MVTSPGYVAYADKLPDLNTLVTAEPEDSMIYAADGTTLLADLHPPGYQHYYEPISDIGHAAARGCDSIEDRNFYQEPGVDPQGVVRATLTDWRAYSSVEGASTITQQLPSCAWWNAPTIDRKIREALLAFEIERHFTKTRSSRCT